MTDSQRWMIFVGVLIGAWLTYFLSPVLVPLVFSFLLAYFLDPVVLRLHKWHVPRVIAAFAVFIVAAIVVTIICLALIPSLEKQTVQLVQALPQMFSWFNDKLLPWINSTLHIKENVDLNSARDLILQHIQMNGGIVQTIFTTIAHSGYTIMEVLLNLVMIPVVTLYLLCDWEKVKKQGQLYIPLPSEDRETFLNLMKECGDRLAGFIRGQLLVMIGLAIVYSIGLFVVGLDVALLIGVFSGVMSVVPYLGFFSGIVLALAASALQFGDWWHIIGVIIVYAIGEICESFVFSPFFVGDRIGLHPVAVIFAVLIGGRLFGFIGVLLALPISAVIMVFFRHLCNRYFPSKNKGEHV